MPRERKVVGLKGWVDIDYEFMNTFSISSLMLKLQAAVSTGL